MTAGLHLQGRQLFRPCRNKQMRNVMTHAQSVALGRWLRRRAENVLVALLSTMFAGFIIQIFFRYVLNNPLGWTEEVIITMWLWIVLWGAAFILTEAEEIRFDIIYSNIPESVRRVFTTLTGSTAVCLYGVSLPASYRYVSFMKVERSAYLHVPINLMYSVYIIFSVACIVRYSWLVYHAIRGDPSPVTDPAKVGD
jgi:C4-dicarboxylate transporter DctQ subunit